MMSATIALWRRRAARIVAFPTCIEIQRKARHITQSIMTSSRWTRVRVLSMLLITQIIPAAQFQLYPNHLRAFTQFKRRSGMLSNPGGLRQSNSPASPNGFQHAATSPRQIARKMWETASPERVARCARGSSIRKPATNQNVSHRTEPRAINARGIWLAPQHCLHKRVGTALMPVIEILWGTRVALVAVTSRRHRLRMCAFDRLGQPYVLIAMQGLRCVPARQYGEYASQQLVVHGG